MRAGLRKIFAMLTVIAMVFSMVPSALQVKAAENADYTLEDGVLTVYTDTAMGEKAWEAEKGSITSVIIEEGVTYISDAAFSWSNTEKVTIPSTVKSVGIDAFKGCYNLTAITIPEGVEKINKYAFMQTGLKEIMLPSTVDFVDEYAVGYDYDGDLGENVVIKDFVIRGTSAEACRYAKLNGIKFIPADAEGYILENGVLTVPDNTVMSAKGWTKYKDGIKEVVIKEGVTFISNGAFEWSAVANVTIPKTVITIGDDAFKGCYNLTDIIIPEGVENINGYAFMQTGLRSIQIPKTIKYMGKCSVGYDYTDQDVLIDGFVIQGYTNTVAEDYARTNNISFTSIGKVVKNLSAGKVLNITAQKYTGRPILPKPVVLDANGTVLTEGVDYTLTYKNNTNAGTATVIVTGIGNYQGTLTKTFTIEKSGVEKQTTKTSNKKVKVAKVKFKKVKNVKGRKILLKWKRNKKATGYQIQYSLKKNYKKAKKITIRKNKTVSIKIKKLKKKKTYFVRIRCYKKLDGKKYYSAWTSKKIKIKK